MSELTKLTTRTPTEAQLDAARDWSRVYVGAPIGNEAATGCWKAMFDALPISPAPDARDEALKLAREALAGVIRVADRKTTEFDAARHALAAIDAVKEIGT